MNVYFMQKKNFFSRFFYEFSVCTVHISGECFQYLCPTRSAGWLVVFVNGKRVRKESEKKLKMKSTCTLVTQEYKKREYVNYKQFQSDERPGRRASEKEILSDALARVGQCRVSLSLN
jgi:hypothetical protein